MNVPFFMLSRATVRVAIKGGPPHLRPIYRAMRDARIGHTLVSQHAGPFRLPNIPGRPWVVVLGDDAELAFGPSAFHLPSVSEFTKSCSSAAVVSGSPLVETYRRATTHAALKRENVVIVETRSRFEIEWVRLLKAIKPELDVLLQTYHEGCA